MFELHYDYFFNQSEANKYVFYAGIIFNNVLLSEQLEILFSYLSFITKFPIILNTLFDMPPISK